MTAARSASRILDIAAGAAAAPGAAVALHLGLLTVAAVARRRNTPPSVATVPLPHFAIVVPAHNEAAGIAATVHSLATMDYPADHRRILVVADNCTDDTPARATRAGADVVVRADEKRRGKGFALAAGLANALADPAVDAVVVVDADTLVEPALLAVAAAAMGRGALVMQADYRVLQGQAVGTRADPIFTLNLWDTVRNGKVYVQGHWKKDNGKRWEWIPGHWNT